MNKEDHPPEILAIIAKGEKGQDLTDAEKKTLRDYRDRRKQTLPTFADSMKAAAGMLKLDVSIVEAAKRAGCQAFRSSRVYLSELEDYLKDFDYENAAAELADKELVELEIKKEDLRKRKLANDIAEGSYVHISELAPFLLTLAESTKSLLRDALEVRFPEIAQGKTHPQLREIGAKEADYICKQFQKSIDPYLSN
jgi:hypothetical protein